MRILFVGDVVGRTGREAVAAALPKLRAALGLDLVVVNAESCACAAPLTTKEAPGSVWNTAEMLRSVSKSCARLRCRLLAE